MRFFARTTLALALTITIPITISIAGCGDDDPMVRPDAGMRADSGDVEDRDAQSPGVDAQSPGVDAFVPEECAGGPLAAPIPGCAPTRPPTTGDPAQDCVDRINQFRWECQCLPPLERWTEGEACADMHGEYDSTRSPHSGFRDGICSPGGNGQNECPGYSGVDQVIGLCLQQMWDEGPGEPFSEHGHYLNMTNPSFRRVACGFYQSPGGGMWAVQNFGP